MRRAPPRMTKRGVFFGLMALSAMVCLLPPRTLGWLDSAAQPLIWLQWAISGGARTMVHEVGGLAEPLPTRDERRQWLNENERLRRQVDSQRQQLSDMEARLLEVTRLRAALGDMKGPLVYAAILAGDAAPRRDTLLIGRGSRSDPPVRRGDWVIGWAPGATPSADVSGREVAEQSALTGQIEDVFAYSSRVRLISDPGFGPLRARVAKRLEDGTVLLSDEECLVVGAGRGRLRIDDAPRNYLAEGYASVMTSMTDALPAPLAIGKIVSAEALAKSALHFDLSVEPAYDRGVSHVYVIQAP